jgi:hypothetical protein
VSGWLGGVNSRALQQRDRFEVVGERWFWRSRGPGLQVHASGRRYKLQESESSSSSSRLGSIARERGGGLGFEARWGARLPTALLGGAAAPLTSCLAGHGGREGEGEQVPGGAAVQLCSRRSPDEGVGGGRWACRRLSPWGIGDVESWIVE